MAMDFSGKSGGRVIQNPMEAQSAEREEALSWRVREAWGWPHPQLSLHSSLSILTVSFFVCALPQKREALRCSLPNLNSGTRPSCECMLHIFPAWSGSVFILLHLSLSVLTRSHPQVSAVVPWGHFQEGSTEADREARFGGRVSATILSLVYYC